MLNEVSCSTCKYSMELKDLVDGVAIMPPAAVSNELGIVWSHDYLSSIVPIKQCSPQKFWKGLGYGGSNKIGTYIMLIVLNEIDQK